MLTKLKAELAKEAHHPLFAEIVAVLERLCATTPAPEVQPAPTQPTPAPDAVKE